MYLITKDGKTYEATEAEAIIALCGYWDKPGRALARLKKDGGRLTPRGGPIVEVRHGTP